MVARVRQADDPQPGTHLGCAGRLHVLVSDDVPLLGHGLAAALGGSACGVARNVDAAAWAAEVPEPRASVVMDASRRVTQVAGIAAAGVPVLAMVTTSHPSALIPVVAAGAVGLIRQDVPLSEIVHATSDVASGRAFMPIEMLRAIVDAGLVDVGAIARDERLLMTIMSGTTVGEMAEQFGYSEREMYRRLRKVYDRMGVRGRKEAMAGVLARQSAGPSALGEADVLQREMPPR